MSERVTWETCPRCGRTAAVGWQDDTPVEVDCPGECRITTADFVRDTAATRGPSPLMRWSTAVHRWS